MSATYVVHVHVKYSIYGTGKYLYIFIYYNISFIYSSGTVPLTPQDEKDDFALAVQYHSIIDPTPN